MSLGTLCVKIEVEEVCVKGEAEECENEEHGAYAPHTPPTPSHSTSSFTYVKGGECEVSADLLDLYVGHQVKDELVLGPEELHRPCVPSSLPVSPNRAEEARRRACSVRLERLPVDVERYLLQVGLYTYTQRSKPRNRREKRFKCSQCDYKCVWKSDLQRHEKIHTGEKLVNCSQCDYKCSEESNLKIHQRLHTGEKPYKCSHCDYKCRWKSNLRNHEKTHTGEKPFQCSDCNYKSSRKSDLKNHSRKHTGEKLFRCSHCNYKCTFKSGLQIHQRKHTGEKPI